MGKDKQVGREETKEGRKEVQDGGKGEKKKMEGVERAAMQSHRLRGSVMAQGVNPYAGSHLPSSGLGARVLMVTAVSPAHLEDILSGVVTKGTLFSSQPQNPLKSDPQLLFSELLCPT